MRGNLHIRAIWLCSVVVAACSAGADTVSPRATSSLHFTAIAAGARHTCALEQSGGVWCWGNDDAGQLGTDSLLSTMLPARTASAPPFAAIYAADDHTCGATAANQLFCWGAGKGGQLGDGLRANRSTPAPVADTFHFAQVAVGDSVTCGLTGGGTAYCWGKGVYGGLGNGLLADSAAPGKPILYPSLRYTYVAAGGQHGCAITDQGVTRCWGVNNHGQDGTGNTVGLASPEPVDATVRFARVFAGGEHSCGLTADGHAYCWGRGDTGALGNGELRDALSPVPVAGPLTFKSLTLGGEDTCGLASDGRAYCWGDNFEGRLGTGGPPGAQATPAPVDGATAFVQLSAGKLHTCGVAADGSAWCWGSGAFGQLGNAQLASQPRPVRVSR